MRNLNVLKRKIIKFELKTCISSKALIRMLPMIITVLAVNIVRTKAKTMLTAMILDFKNPQFSLVLYTELNEVIIDITPWVEAKSAKKNPKESRLCRGLDTMSTRVELIFS